jgi:hypothetical protein
MPAHLMRAEAEQEEAEEGEEEAGAEGCEGALKYAHYQRLL